MLALLECLPELFQPERLGRFDQQVTSRFHRDGAPVESLLLLGYEASDISSTLSFADAHAAALNENLDIETYLARFNPMYPEGEARLRRFQSDVSLPLNRPVLVAINNSLLPHDPTRQNPLGVLHKAVVPTPDPTKRRVINSIGLARVGPFKTADEIAHFLHRTDLE